ncbi:MAG: CoA-binding protein [Candidatus Helarchaeota archaeon]
MSLKSSPYNRPIASLDYRHPFDYLFYARNITIVGATPKPNFGVGMFISAFRHSFYSNPIYLVNPKYAGKLQEIKGYPLFASISEIPETELDYVICSIKARFVPDLVRECVEKKVKFICIFSSGFGELRSQEAKQKEDEIRALIKGTNTRVIGPNCLGVMCPKTGITFNPHFKKVNGNIAFASQSGGIATTLIEIQAQQSLYYSKGISFGNQIDLNCVEMLEYYSQDPDTAVIGMYLESIGPTADGNTFFKLMREVTKTKPVVIWKGGQTKAGYRAAASHTGAMAGSFKIWQTAVMQAGGTFVTRSTEFWDTIHLFSRIIPTQRLPKGRRIGLIVAGGGASVEMADTFSSFGFEIPEFPLTTQESLQTLFPAVNTSVRNPVDTGATGLIIDPVIKAIKLMDKAGCDILVFYSPMNWLSQIERQGAPGHTLSVARSLGRLNKKLAATFIIICPILQLTEFNAKISLPFKEILWKRGVPHFETIARAAIALNHAVKYRQKWEKVS